MTIPSTSLATRRGLGMAAATLAMVWLAPLVPVRAMPQAPATVCTVYPDSPFCQGAQPACTLCHTAPPARNAFGDAIAAQLAAGAPRPLDPAVFTAELPAALADVDALDADGDSISNGAEILAGSWPADAASLPAEAEAAACAEQPAGSEDAPDSWAYQVCDRDAVYTFAKVLRDTCGRSPMTADLEALHAAQDPWQHIHETLDQCLGQNYWRGVGGVLWNIANRKIKPSASLKAGQDPGAIPLGDYEDDYNLFVYTQIDGHDARELLTAQYMVARIDDTPTRYEPYTREPAEDVRERGARAAQLVTPARRAGMITTRWFLATNTMFTALPRTSAAQAYRAYLGLDIAKLQGLMPVSGEPVDYDNKSVSASACAVCHATLDPLTYPFSRYEGLAGRSDGTLPGTYNPDRLARFADETAPDVASTPEAGALLGQPVSDLLDWAQVAAESNEFARATVLDYWLTLVGEPPAATELAEFDRLWQAFKTEHGYSIDRMIHDLIDTEAYSVP